MLAFTKRGIERLTDAHVFDVAGLIDQLGPQPQVVHNRAALLADRRELAKRVIRWCPEVERLGRWLIRVCRWFGVDNLAGYLRRACEKGDPGTVLESALKNRVGRAAETWQDFSATTERTLQGEYADDVAKLTAATTTVLKTPEGPLRDALRKDLQAYLETGRRAAARTVLLQLVGTDRSDVAIVRAIGDVCTLAVAKELLAA